MVAAREAEDVVKMVSDYRIHFCSFWRRALYVKMGSGTGLGGEESTWSPGSGEWVMASWILEKAMAGVISEAEKRLASSTSHFQKIQQHRNHHHHEPSS